MIYHLSIPAYDTKVVSHALAEFMGPQATIHRFPIDPRGYFVLSNNQPIAAIEVYPNNLQLIPGQDEEGQFTPVTVMYKEVGQYSSTHFALQSPLSKEEVIDIGNKNGWQTLYCRRGENFRVVEVWLENRHLVEVIAREDQGDTLTAHNSNLWGANLRENG